MTPYFRRRVLRAALSLVLAAGLADCGGRTPEEVDSESVVTVEIEPAVRGDMQGVVHATGVVSPAPGAELVVVAPDAARILEIPHAAGEDRKSVV